MKGTVDFIDGVSFQVTSGGGHKAILDGPEEKGGQNRGMRPMEMVLLGMGGCTAYDIVEILCKSRAEKISLRIEMEAERADSIPAVFTAIHLKYIVAAKNTSDRQVERAIELSLDKYCSATRMLSSTAVVTFDFELNKI